MWRLTGGLLLFREASDPRVFETMDFWRKLQRWMLRKKKQPGICTQARLLGVTIPAKIDVRRVACENAKNFIAGMCAETRKVFSQTNTCFYKINEFSDKTKVTLVAQEFLDTWQDFEIGPYPQDAHLYWVIAEALIKEVPGNILNVERNGKVILHLT